MTTNNALFAEHRLAQSSVRELAASELADFMSGLDLAKPEAAQAALRAFVPHLVQDYGKVAAALSAEWYEQLGGDPADLSPGMPEVAIRKQLAYTTRKLYSDTPTEAIPSLQAMVDKYVAFAGRDTVRLNSERDHITWARVPAGPRTCAWCLMLASRGAAYATRDAALMKADGTRYHDHCDCHPVPVELFGGYPAGYDPNFFYEIYADAKKQAGSNNLGDILKTIRRDNPDFVTDGVHVEEEAASHHWGPAA